MGRVWQWVWRGWLRRHLPGPACCGGGLGDGASPLSRLAPRAAAAADRLQAALVALQDVGTSLSTSASASAAALSERPAVVAARGMVAHAVEEVGRSVTHLRSVPVTEVPVVASLEALQLARAALAAVSSAIGSAYAASGAEGAVAVARDRASHAVADATTAVASLRTTAPALAGRTAARLDASLHVSERVAALNETYRVQETLVGVASRLDADYDVSTKVSALAESAKRLDERLTGGTGASIVSSVVATATQLASAVATAYVAEAARGRDGAAAGAATADVPRAPVAALGGGAAAAAEAATSPASEAVAPAGAASGGLSEAALREAAAREVE